MKDLESMTKDELIATLKSRDEAICRAARLGGFARWKGVPSHKRSKIMRATRKKRIDRVERHTGEPSTPEKGGQQ